MHIEFWTETTSDPEKRALITLLAALLPTTDSGQNLTPQTSAPTLQDAIQATTDADAPQAQSTTGPTLVPETTTRKRRTKAEIAADEAATKAAAEAAPVTTEAAPIATPSALPTTKLSADELRTLLNAYIAKYSMEKALEVLGAFECSRVSEALELEPVKFSALVAALNG